MAQVIVFPRGQLNDADKARMADAGIVAVEADDPAKVVTAIPCAPLASTDDIATVALYAIVESVHSGRSRPAEVFAMELLKRVKAKEHEGGSHG